MTHQPPFILIRDGLPVSSDNVIDLVRGPTRRNQEVPIRVSLQTQAEMNQAPKVSNSSMLTLKHKIETSKGDNLNLIRLIMAIAVVFSHSFALTNGQPEPLFQWTHDVSFGTLAVYSFFFISGFLITGSWERSQSFLDFMMKRVLRIYPGFIAALVGCAMLIWVICPEFKGFIIGSHQTTSWLKSVAHDAILLQCESISDIHAFAHNPRPGLTNAPLWTIPLEFTAYVAVMVAGVCCLLRNRWLVLLITGLGYEFCILMQQRYNHQQDQFFLCFACGAVAWLFRDKIPVSGRLAAVALGILVATSHFKPFFSIAFPTAGGYCLLWLAYSLNLPLARWTSKTDLSYGTYLFACPIQQILTSYMTTYTLLQNPLVQFTIALPITLVIAFVSWTVIEKPCLSLKRGFRKSQPVLATA
jgi:peptidoglycan/LPS O-acetylase OafA/YrhL